MTKPTLQLGKYYTIERCDSNAPDVYKAISCKYTLCQQPCKIKIRLEPVKKLQESWLCWPACLSDGWRLKKQLSKIEVALFRL